MRSVLRSKTEPLFDLSVIYFLYEGTRKMDVINSDDHHGRYGDGSEDFDDLCLDTLRGR